MCDFTKNGFKCETDNGYRYYYVKSLNDNRITIDLDYEYYVIALYTINDLYTFNVEYDFSTDFLIKYMNNLLITGKRKEILNEYRKYKIYKLLNDH